MVVEKGGKKRMLCDNDKRLRYAMCVVPSPDTNLHGLPPLNIHHCGSGGGNSKFFVECWKHVDYKYSCVLFSNWREVKDKWRE